MPGFPIRTSSDQRSIDNSPRLNAALHVLHRPSMPRHPPCALHNEHTTNTATTTNMAVNKPCWCEHTKHKRTKKSHKPHNLTPQHHTKQCEATSMRLNARVHYTVLTQHPTQDNNHTTKGKAVIETHAGYNQGTMPQTPNNAPSTYINKLTYPCWSTHHTG